MRSCPAGLRYKLHAASGLCYAFEARRVSFSDAAARCARAQGALVSIHSEQENVFVSDLILRAAGLLPSSVTTSWTLNTILLLVYSTHTRTQLSHPHAQVV